MSELQGHPAPAMQMPSPTAAILPRVVGPITILLCIALLTYVLRLYSRLSPYFNLRWDDHIMSLAVSLTITNYALTIAIMAATGGKHVEYISLATLVYISKLGYASRYLWIWSVTTIKISVALMMLRIKQSTRWRIGIASLVAALLVLSISQTIALLVQCRPIRENWNLMSGNKCWGPDIQAKITYLSTALFAATDIACALLPLAFITKINRPLREKLVLAVLMGLGIFACICGLMKAVLLKKALRASDPLWANASVTVWTYSEEYIGITAANIPCLRTLLQEAFSALGGRVTRSGTTGRTYDMGDSGTKDNHTPQPDDGCNYHDFVRKEDLELMGADSSKQVLVTHQIETTVGVRNPGDSWDNAPESKWDVEI